MFKVKFQICGEDEIIHYSLSPKEQKDLILAAMETNTNEQFVMFRRNLAYDNKIKIKARKYYNYVLSLSVAKNRNQFKKMCEDSWRWQKNNPNGYDD